MATLTNEQTEQKKQQMAKLNEEANALFDEPAEAKVCDLSDDDLEHAAGGQYVVRQR